MPPKDQFNEVQLLLKGCFALNTPHIAYFFLPWKAVMGKYQANYGQIMQKLQINRCPQCFMKCVKWI